MVLIQVEPITIEMMEQYFVLITGANRGIGAALASLYLSRPYTTVVATFRQGADLPSLNQHPSPGSKLIWLKLSLDTANGASRAADEMRQKHDIHQLNLVIANAGICDSWGPAYETPESDVAAHFEVNSMGLLRLYKAFWSLLRSTQQPRMVYISTALASIGSESSNQALTTAYGMSKVAGNYLIEKINSEHDDLIAFPINPGFVQTDMGNRGAKVVGIEQAPMPVKESAAHIIKQIDDATKENTSGRFLNYDGTTLPW